MHPSPFNRLMHRLTRRDAFRPPPVHEVGVQRFWVLSHALVNRTSSSCMAVRMDAKVLI
jgi:hypothetical protein